ncbi:MAG: thermonuclease family protein [Cyanobacteria bacterium J06642_9]
MAITPNIGPNPTIGIELPSQATPDAYGRVWAYVWCDGQLANEQLVFNGHAIAQLDAIDDRNLTYQAQLSRAQNHARLAGLGIWNPAQPMRSTPAEFRQQ